MRGWFDGAGVVGLGESVRGVRSGHELYEIKGRLLRLLIEELGFHIVALEDTHDVGAVLDDDGPPGPVADRLMVAGGEVASSSATWPVR
jgi:hypothetical protein